MRYTAEYNGIWFRVIDTEKKTIIAQAFGEKNAVLILSALNHYEKAGLIFEDLKKIEIEQSKQD